MVLSAEVGKIGEKLAGKYLAGKGYKILETNRRLGHKEIDLICEFENLTVFVEVKTAKNTSPIKPEEMINTNKIGLFKRAISLYCYEQKISISNARADLVAISLNFEQKMANIKHFKNIF